MHDKFFFLIYKKTISGLNFDSANYYLKTVNYLQFIWLSDMQRSLSTKEGVHGTPTIFMVVINCFVQLSK